jgi:hypothetical protein
VLVISGVNSTGSLSSAELYNPAMGKWAATGSPGAASSGYTTTVLPDGQLLLVGGEQAGTATSGAELYNPATGSMTTARAGHTATLLQNGQAGPSAQRDFSATLLGNGQVLFSGGLNGTYPAKVHVRADATLFDPATATSTATGSMTIPRAFHTLTVLQNGQVLAAGGETQNNVGKFSITASSELYRP